MLRETMGSFVGNHPVHIVLISLMIIDIVMGLLVAFGTRTVCSTVSFRGVSKKIGTIALVVAATIVQPYAQGIPTENLTSGFYCLTEFISVLEKAGRLGIPLPFGIRESLLKLKGEEAPPAIKVQMVAPAEEPKQASLVTLSPPESHERAN